MVNGLVAINSSIVGKQETENCVDNLRIARDAAIIDCKRPLTLLLSEQISNSNFTYTRGKVVQESTPSARKDKPGGLE